MSNEPTSKRLLAPPSPASAEPPGGTRSDADRIAAALERMETAVRGEPDTIERLRADLVEVVETIAQIRAAVDAAGQRYTDVGVLLQDLERRTQRMMILVGPVSEAEPRPADEQAFLAAMSADESTAPQAGAARVPTVSGVVSQLGRAADSAAADTSEPDRTAGGNVTTVAMLEAMVEELAASMPAGPRSEAPAPDAGSPAPEWTSTTGEAASDEPVMPEVDLLSNFARVEERPYLPADLGTAVIFEAKARPEAKAPGEPVTETTSEADDSDLDALLFEPPGEAESDPAAFLLEPPPLPAHGPPAAEPSQDPMSVSSETPAAEASQPSIVEQPPPAGEPAAEPQSAWNVELPPLAVTKRASEPHEAWTIEPPSPANVALPPLAAAAQDRPPLAAGAAHDPFAPLRAMTDEEKIALFE
jgi:hypothetical protein